MSVPLIHAESSVKKFGGKVEDYLQIHQLMDSSGIAFPDLRHRALTHNIWFIRVILVKVFGELITNSEGKRISVVEIGQRHVMEDYNGKFIPTAGDFLAHMSFETWMNNGESNMPESNRGIHEWEKKKEETTELVILPAPSSRVDLSPLIPDEPPFSPKRGCGGGRFD